MMKWWWILILLLMSGCGSLIPKCTVSKLNSVSTISCPDGTSVKVLDGVNGINGTDGTNGQGCVISPNSLGAQVTCGNSSVQIDNGTDGTNGTSVQEVPFCPGLGGGIGFNEFGLQIGSDLFAVYFDGSHVFLTKLKPGSYVTTDGRNCYFTI